MDAVSDVTRVSLNDVEPIPLPGGSWSRMLVTGDRVQGARSSLGTSIFTVGSELPPVCHETEEFAYVVAGTGELRLDDGPVPFGPGDALHIPAGVWHGISVTGDEDVAMVFGFPHPDYPPTERR